MAETQYSSRLRSRLPLIVAATLSSVGPAVAEGLMDADPQEELEEIVVTARKRSELLLDTPVSVSALTATDLNARGIARLDQLDGAAANLTWQSSPAGGNSTVNLYIRGVGQFDFIATSDQSVGLYLDDVYLARSLGAAFDVIDIERIEVLRGPQGTLFGRNTMGGAVRVISQEPTDRLSGSVKVSGGARRRADVIAMLSGPIADSLSGRLSVARLSQDGYGRRLLTGEDTGNVNNSAVRGQLRWLPADGWEVKIGADASRRRGHTSPEKLLSNDDANPILLAYNAAYVTPQGFQPLSSSFLTADPLRSWAGTPNRDDYDARGGSATVTWQSPLVAFKSTSAWRSLQTSSDYDFDGTPYPFLDQSVDVDQQQWSQEFQLSGAAFDARIDYVAGLYYFREHVAEDNDVYITAPIARTGPGRFDFATLGLGAGYVEMLDQTTNSAAAYGQGTWHFNTWLSTTAGLRYTFEEKKFTSGDTGALVRPLNTVSDHWNSFTPRLGVEFKLRQNELLYLSSARGFRSGGFNGRETQAAAPDSYDPEHIWAYELGFKGEFWARRLRLGSALYYYDYTDKQGTALKQNSSVTVGNIGRVALMGLDFEADLLAAPGLRVSMGAGFNHQHIREIDPSGRLALHPDTRLENAPTVTLNSTATYTHALGQFGSLSVVGAVRYKSAHEFLIPNYPGERQSAYAIADARTLWTRGNWTLELFLLNLTDKSYRVFTESTLGFGFPGVIGTYGRPREWGASIRYEF